MKYPYCHFLRHPWLATLVAINYALRRLGILEDKFYPQDEKLLKSYEQETIG